MDVEREFFDRLAGPLGGFFLVAVALNVWAAGRALGRRAWLRGGLWAAVAAGFAALAAAAWCGRPLVLPEGFKHAVDATLNPVSVSLGWFVGLAGLYLGRAFFVRPAVAWSIFNASWLLLGLSLTDPQFAAVAARPDHVPIVGMVYLLGFFTWLATAQAVANDRRLAAGEPPLEKRLDAKVLTWPDLVYTELICMLLVSAVLIAWSLSLRAPLEQPANPAVTPNPSKAPWYFLGLQELLVFSDAWYAGVVVPGLILLGLMAIPYLDVNRQGSGYYTIRQRPFAYPVFQFGFLQLWILLILIGTFMRGPDWNFFGPYEVRAPHKLVELANVKLSTCFWGLFGGPPQVPDGAAGLARLGHVAWRELPGLVLAGLYFLVLPLLLGLTVMRRLRREMGLLRFTLMVVLLLLMFTLPLKMILRWSFHLSYFIGMPEYSFNF